MFFIVKFDYIVSSENNLYMQKEWFKLKKCKINYTEILS